MLIILGTLGLARCAVPVRPRPTIDEPQLMARIDTLYAADQRGDFKTWYSLMAPTLQKSITLREFTADGRNRNLRVVSWKILTIREIPDFQDHLEKHAGEGTEVDLTRVSSAVEVAMEVFVVEGGKTRLEKDQTDYWMRYDNTWYWYWRGWPGD